ncbi:uncharacterized protein LOC126680245 [Mercurialis annua]|uniref:uncharacterized protein LOC126680245 n=1 Tax=Mercurialis annua TaxID=3986 RepID=UPI002160CCA3|nr:uncharacterized protein LOC126680245 [Mercurialis annua]
MAVVLSSSTTTTIHLLHRFLRPPPPPPPLLSSFSGPISSSSSTTTTTANFTNKKPLMFLSNYQKNTTTPLFSSLQSPLITPHSLLFANSISTSLSNHSISLEQEQEQEDDMADDVDDDETELELEDNGGAEGSLSPKEAEKEKIRFEVPNLTVKEKKDLASYANSLGKKLKSQLIGKSGFTDNVATSFIETLEANELLKIKIHRTCPGELEDVIRSLEEATGSVVVGQIGRTVIIYRPSLSKMEAEEKRRQARKMYVRKESRFKPITPMQRKAQVPRFSARGQRGSSRTAQS